MPAPLSFKNDDKADERLNPATNLKAQEQQAGSSSGDVSGSYVNAGIDQAESFANDPANHSTTENIDNTKDRELSSGWRQNFTGKGGGAKKFNLKGFARKKGPIGLIISLLLGGGILGGSFFGPAIALIHIKEVVENKVDTMASVVDTRMQKIIASRMKAQGVSGKCSGMIKIKCRFNTFSEEQLASMKEQGIKVVDGNGKEIEAGTKPTGEARMILQDGESIKASEFATKIKSDASFRNSLRDIYPTRFNVWNDRAAGLFEKAKGLIRDPKSIGSDEGGDPKKNQTEFNENLQEETAQGQNPTTSIDEGQYGNQINEEEAN
ncbi:MAG TPA: hypothetical protein VFQ70_02205, partial [Candidatus Saccharimonadaceae bacterium]|nr:hypothetical protein [Candidatus Saccharimonadaceae bacterium]